MNTESRRAHQVDFGGIQAAAPLAIAAPGALYAVAFFQVRSKNSESNLLPPFGRETALRGRP